jgi:sigma-B regulation protein RsbU (phosphoserine phosphatase)
MSEVRAGLPAVSVLLVDDQLIIGEAVRRMLATQPDIAYRFLADPTKAVELALELKPTVILQDLVMPAVDGLDLVVKYREQEALKETPIIVLSSKEEATTKAEAFARGANDYLVKLPDPIELLARIRHHSRGYVAQLERNEAFRKLAESEAHMAAELGQAASYVASLLDAPIDVPTLRTKWVFIPSASLGGDSFGYHWIDENRFACYVIDVCGHGVGPALMSVSALSLIRSLPPDEAGDPKTVLNRLNVNFPMSRHRNMFFTIWYGVIDRRDRSLVWSGAAHPPAVLLRGDQLQLFDSQSTMIGIVPDLDATNDRTALQPGDKLCLYSDGVFELLKPDGKMWNIDGLHEAMRGRSSEEIVKSIPAITHAIRGSDQYDDDYSIVEIDIR